MKRKYQDPHNYYANLNSFEEGCDYEEDYQEEPEVVVAETRRGRRSRRRDREAYVRTFTNIPKSARGHWVRKKFGGKVYLGRIESVGTATGRESGKGDVEAGQQFACVKFLGGYQEDIDAQELKEYAPPSPLIPAPPRRPPP